MILETDAKEEPQYEQLDLFTDFSALQAKRKKEEEELEKEKKMQQAMLEIKKKFGKKCHSEGHESAGGGNSQGSQPTDRRS